MMIKYKLPVPPTVNKAYATVGKTGRRVLSKEGRDYKDLVRYLIYEQGKPVLPIVKRVTLECKYYPSDKKRRDLDNMGKLLLDALGSEKKKGYKGIYKDDSQIDYLSFERCELVDDPYIIVKIGEKEILP